MDLKSIGGKLDSVITKIEVNQERAVFNKNIFILGDKPSKFWTNSNKIYVSTWHESSLQTLMLNGSKELKLTESQTTQPFDLGAESGETKPNTLYQIESPLNDIIVETDGYFTFNPESFFNPDVIRTKDINTVSDLNDYDYVLTTVSKAQKDGEWLVSDLLFSPTDFRLDGKNLYFSLEIPELAKYGGEL